MSDDNIGLENFHNSLRSFGESSHYHADQSIRSAKEVKNMAAAETNSHRVWRLVVVVIILITGALLATVTYFLLNNQEEDDQDHRYEMAVQTISDASRYQLSNFYSAMRDMSNSITSQAIISDQPWPFVTLKQWEVQALHAREKSNVEKLIIVPTVARDELERWNNYAVFRYGWMVESKEILMKAGSSVLEIDMFQDGRIGPNIYMPGENGLPMPVETQREGPYHPMWQQSPPPFEPYLINLEMMSMEFFETYHNAAMQHKEGIFTNVVSVEKYFCTEASKEAHKRFHARFVDLSDGQAACTHPHAVYLQPVFKQVMDPSSEIVATLMALVPWDSYLAAILPEGVNGLTVVLENSCGQQFTYELNGQKVMYMGEGDLHDRAYSNARKFIPLSNFINPETEAANDHCVYSFAIYSSAEFDERSSDSSPAIILPIVVGITFVVMAIAFFFYDRFVQKRNFKVMEAAEKSNELLWSVFPSTVRDRLFAEDKEKNLPQPSSRKLTRTKSLSTAFLDSEDITEADLRTSKPIADLFPETTIFFGDLVGFTAWSSVREPSQVFELLETLFQTFDEIARKRGVYKVETVGDCYVAVCGLPQARKDHAVAMAKFARDCMRKMHQLTSKLEVTLGPDTADLNLRVGMHSGPITAGVLRSDRCRFQLFGDTMNTASRMESNSKPGRIQVSQETADLLIAAGREDWVTPRQDKIKAKGKGMLQTYWLEAPELVDGESSAFGSTAYSTDDEADIKEQMGKTKNKEKTEEAEKSEEVIEALKPSSASVVSDVEDF